MINKIIFIKTKIIYSNKFNKKKFLQKIKNIQKTMNLNKKQIKIQKQM